MTMTSFAPTAYAVTAVDDDLRADLLRCWTDVSNAGGSVGFVPPVSSLAVEPVLDALLRRVQAGTHRIITVRDGAELLGFAVLSRDENPLREHLGTVQRVQIRPEHQGRRLGGLLLSAVHDAASEMGLQMLHLTVRGATGREAFYQRLGYREFGRLPDGVRLGPEEYRDEIYLYVRL